MPRARLFTCAAIALLSAVAAADQTRAPEAGGGTATPLTAPRAQTVNPDARSAIEGLVVAQGTGVPLRGAKVHLTGNGSTPSRPLNRTALTDRRGLYRFDEVPRGRYTITASFPGFLQMHAGQAHPLGRSHAWVGPSSATDRLDFALPRGAVIAGRLTDTSGEPVPGIRLTTLRVIYQANGERLTPYTALDGHSDDRGNFRVGGLLPGTYVLGAQYQSDESGDRLLTTYYPGTTNPHEAERIEIGLSEQVDASFAMLEGRPARISGHVRSSNGTPLQNARLALRTDQGVFQNWGLVRNASGAFEVPGVTPGEYVLEVKPSSPGSRPELVRHTEFAFVKLSVGKDDLTGLEVTTGLGTTITGRVSYEGSSPTPAAGTWRRVYLEHVDVRPWNGSPPSVRANGSIAEDGSFTVNGGYGRMLFRARPPGWQLKSVSLNGTDITDVPYDSSRGDIKDLEIVLTDRRQELKGTVVNASGKPVSRFVVVVFPTELPEGAVPGRFVRLLSPNDDGTFRTTNLPAGSYLAAAFETIDQEVQWNPEFRKAIAPRATPFHLSLGRTQQLELPLIE